jgi:hypothetical protein
MTIEGPDFICIGQPKAATGWLYDQLQFHPDFWMPPIKEIGYLQHEVGKLSSSGKRLRRLKRNEANGGDDAPPDGEAISESASRADLDRRRNTADRDMQFLKMAKRLRGEERDLARYKELFAPKGELLSGDITPGYGRLDADLVAQVAEEMPQTKILFLVRDPVARAWSAISMANRGRGFDHAVLEDRNAFRTFVEENRRINDASRASVIAERWRSAAPALPFRIVLFDDISEKPDEVLGGILAYVGADPQKRSELLPPRYNRKSTNEKLEMTDITQSVLVEIFADELKASAARFGGAAERWPAKYGL